MVIALFQLQLELPLTRSLWNSHQLSILFNSDTKLLMPTKKKTTNSIRCRFIYDPRALTSGKQVKFESGMSNNVWWWAGRTWEILHNFVIFCIGVYVRYFEIFSWCWSRNQKSVDGRLMIEQKIVSWNFGFFLTDIEFSLINFPCDKFPPTRSSELKYSFINFSHPHSKIHRLTSSELVQPLISVSTSKNQQVQHSKVSESDEWKFEIFGIRIIEMQRIFGIY